MLTPAPDPRTLSLSAFTRGWLEALLSPVPDADTVVDSAPIQLRPLDPRDEPAPDAGAPRIASRYVPVRSLREARITAQLEHPGVIPVHEMGTLPDGSPDYTMRAVTSHSLREVLQEPVPRRAWPIAHVAARRTRASERREMDCARMRATRAPGRGSIGCCRSERVTRRLVR
jgi:hypothetical protein